jgi:esterase
MMILDISSKSYAHYVEHQETIEAMLSVNFDIAKKREDVEALLSDEIKEKRLMLFVLKNLYWVNKGRLGWKLNLASLYENLPYIYEEIHSNIPCDIETLFVKGGKSNYLIESDLPLIRKQFNHFEVKTIENAGHWIHADAPETLLKITRDFF